jgi:hypothetical protein
MVENCVVPLNESSKLIVLPLQAVIGGWELEIHASVVFRFSGLTSSFAGHRGGAQLVGMMKHGFLGRY